jgi:hypothetical protein
MLEDKKPEMQKKFDKVVGSPAPAAPIDRLPADVAEAWKEGFQQGQAKGYGDGLVDGTELGLDVALDAVDVILCQPVFTTWAEA